MDLFQIFTESPHEILIPSQAHSTAALNLAKQYLDGLAINVTEAQQARQNALRKSRKRKRRREDDDEEEEQLRMKQIYIQDFGMDQVVQQARKIITAGVDEVDRDVREIEAMLEEEDASLGEEGVDWEYDGDDVPMDDEPDKDPAEEHASESEENPDEEEDLGEEEGSSPDIGDETPISDMSEAEDDDEGPMQEAGEYTKDPNNLNDGFFSIDDFNKQSQFLEQRDFNGEDDGAASDEEDVDWTVDPLSAAMQSRSKKSRSRRDEDDMDDDDEEDGPTFGNADLNAPWSDDDEDMDMDGADAEDMMGMGGDFSNTNDINYADFFAPPKVAKSSKAKPKSKGNPKKPRKDDDADDDEDEDEDDAEANLENETSRAISNVHRDLFSDDDDDDDIDNDNNPQDSNDNPGNRNLSSHEKRQLALRAEIRRLEAENLDSKPWALTGESVAPARPQNGLLEEDLDFERAGKPVPIVTAAVNESIEDLIKRRILGKEFDEVRRRRPDDLATGPSRRGKFELSDEKSKKGLAEEYEEDFRRANDPNYIDSRSEELKAKHAAIERQWADIASQLDALSNWHHKPRAAQASLDIRVDAPTIAMEDARPNAGVDVAGSSALAPQEVYRVGEEGKREGEVVSKGGAVAAREEETQDQRRRRRRRMKERAKKAGLNKPLEAKAVEGAEPRKERQSEVVKQLKKGGVKVIGKKGDLASVDGKAVAERAERRRAGGDLKL